MKINAYVKGRVRDFFEQEDGSFISNDGIDLGTEQKTYKIRAEDGKWYKQYHGPNQQTQRWIDMKKTPQAIFPNGPSTTYTYESPQIPEPPPPTFYPMTVIPYGSQPNKYGLYTDISGNEYTLVDGVFHFLPQLPDTPTPPFGWKGTEDEWYTWYYAKEKEKREPAKWGWWWMLGLLIGLGSPLAVAVLSAIK